MNMAFVGIEFATDDSAEQVSGAIALIHYTWLTPKKKEVWWPPYKTSVRFKKALLIGEEPKEDTWTLCQVERIFFSYGKLYIYIYILFYYYNCFLSLIYNIVTILITIHD